MNDELDHERRVSDIVTSLALEKQKIDAIEKLLNEDRADSKANRRVLWSIGFAFMVQLGGSLYGYGQLTQTLKNIDIEELKRNITTALTVLGDHGTELQDVRTEQARIRGNIDELWQKELKGRELIMNATRERFYRSDGDKLDARITRLEDLVIKK